MGGNLTLNFFYYNTPLSEASREVENFITRKRHTCPRIYSHRINHHYVCLFIDPPSTFNLRPITKEALTFLLVTRSLRSTFSNSKGQKYNNNLRYKMNVK